MNEHNLKIKLAAIARDEAAYLPEWIFHHLDFGFDEIEIYINNTNDNSLTILDNISQHHPVVVTDANKLFQSSTSNFQLLAYQELTAKAIKDGFTHIMFLDVDEFWTPADFKTNVKKALSKFNFPQALSLNWFIHCDEREFSPCYREQITVQPNLHVKTIFQLDAEWEKIEIHNIVGKEITYTRGDGSLFDFGDSAHCGLTDHHCIDHDFFVIHRMYRSQMEYISLLGRGRANRIKLKDNRNGYYNATAKSDVVTIDSDLLNTYTQRFEQFMSQCQLQPLLKESQGFVKKRFNKVRGWAKRSTVDEAVVFCKLFQRIDLPEIKQLQNKLTKKVKLASIDIKAVETFSWSFLFTQILFKLLHYFKLYSFAARVYLKGGSNHQSMGNKSFVDFVERALINTKYPDNKHADIYREMALYLYQEKQLKLACHFIAKARTKRPDGPYIIKLYDEYMTEQRLRTS